MSSSQEAAETQGKGTASSTPAGKGSLQGADNDDDDNDDDESLIVIVIVIVISIVIAIIIIIIIIVISIVITIAIVIALVLVVMIIGIVMECRVGRCCCGWRHTCRSQDSPAHAAASTPAAPPWKMQWEVSERQ